jgi:HEPN domain-containing protein
MCIKTRIPTRKERRVMTAEEKFEYWLNFSNEDFKTAQAMFKSGRWLYVLFCCQQALEKLVKGLYMLYLGDNIPKIHNINSLFDRFSDKLTADIDDRWRNLFDRLTNFYLTGRPSTLMNLERW